MAKKTLPNMPEVDNKLAQLREDFFEICDAVMQFTKEAGELPSDLTEQMQQRLVLVARDATDAAVRLNATLRSARLRESRPVVEK